MKRTRLTITLRADIVKKLDHVIDGDKIRNRSHAIEHILKKELTLTVHKAVILAAGKGIHFRPFTYEMPKAMLPVKGRPLLEHIITHLREFDIRTIYIAVGYLREKIESYFGDGSKFGVSITYVRQDKENVGTAGALKKCQSAVGGEEAFFLIYGDVLTTINYNDMVQSYEEHKDAAGIVALTTSAQPELWGVATLKGHHIVGFTEKPTKRDAKSHLISAGIYVFNHRIFEYIQSRKKLSLEKDILPTLIAHEKLYGYLLEGDWYDVSTPEVYERVLKSWS